MQIKHNIPLEFTVGTIPSNNDRLCVKIVFIWREITRCCHSKKTVIINNRQEEQPRLVQMAPIAMAAPLEEKIEQKTPKYQN